MLTAFGARIWTAEGGEVTAAMGFRYPTRMAVIRLSDGGLFVWSPVALSPGLRDEVAALGPVRHLVAPNGLHHLFIADWQRAFPEARTHAAPGLPRKRRDIAFDHVLGAAPHPDWAGQVEQVPVPGNAITTEVVFFHTESRTALFADLLQCMAPAQYAGWRAMVARMDLMTGVAPQVPRKFRMAFTRRGAARAAVARILDWPAEKVLMAHGAPVTEGGKEALARAFRWLKV